MSKNNELKAIVTADVSNFNNNMEKIGRTASAATSLIVASFGAATAAVAKFAQMSKQAVQSSEDQRIKLIGLFRDVDKGNAAFQKLQTFADNSALASDDMIESMLILGRNVGPELATSLLPALEDLGFASKNGAGSMREAAEAAGKLIGRFRDFKKIDLDTIDTLKRTSGVSAEFISRLIQIDKSTLTVTKLTKMLTDELSDAAKVMKNETMKSISGLEALLGGKFKQALREAGGEQEGYKKILKATIDLFDKLIGSRTLNILGDEVNNLSNEFAEMLKDRDVINMIEDLTIALSAMVKVATVAAKSIQSIAAVKGYLDAAEKSRQRQNLVTVDAHLKSRGVSNTGRKQFMRSFTGDLPSEQQDRLTRMADIVRQGESQLQFKSSTAGGVEGGPQIFKITDPTTGETLFNFIPQIK